MTIIDLEKFGQLKKKHPQILTAIDGTLASPYLQQPIKYGIDFVIHSCSKYVGGHSDVIGGCVTTASVQHWKQLKWYQVICASDAMVINTSK